MSQALAVRTVDLAPAKAAKPDPMVRTYDLLQRYVRAASSASRTISPDDQPFKQDRSNLDIYLYNGLSALRCMVHALISASAEPPKRILDFACAHGRVMRFLRAAFPEAEIVGADINTKGIEFCAKEFGAIPVQSYADLSKVTLPGSFDLIWCGSLITHIDEIKSRTLLDLFLKHLAPGGLLCFSTHGRIYPLYIQQKRWKLLADDVFEVVNRDFLRTGFGYADYPSRPGIGASLTSPAWIYNYIYNKDDVTLVFFGERAWLDWHDVTVIQRRPLSAGNRYDRYGTRPF